MSDSGDNVVVSFHETEIKRKLVETFCPDVSFTEDEANLLGGMLLEISIRETKLKKLGQDLRICGEVMNYAANCGAARNMKVRDALKRVMAFSQESRT